MLPILLLAKQACRLLTLQPHSLMEIVMARRPGAAPGSASFGDSRAQAGARRA
jgi:hypothetical protein